MHKFLCLLAGVLCHGLLWSQDDKVVDLPITTCDCDGAIALMDGEEKGPMKSNHFGKVLEIRNNAEDDPYFFEHEHNSTWFFIKAPITGEMTLRIVSEDASEDFNFLVFLASGRWFCNKLRSGDEIPIRANQSSAERGRGITGLKIDAMEDYVSIYDDYAFSSSIQTIAGDYYYIVVDNKRNNNHGFKIVVNFYSPDEIDAANAEFEADAKVQHRF